MLRSNFILHKKSSVVITHFISISNIEPHLNFKDLSIIFGSKLYFLAHIEILRNKAMCNLRLIKRTNDSFRDFRF